MLSIIGIMAFATLATVPAILANRRMRLVAKRERDFFAEIANCCGPGLIPALGDGPEGDAALSHP